MYYLCRYGDPKSEVSATAVWVLADSYEAAELIAKVLAPLHPDTRGAYCRGIADKRDTAPYDGCYTCEDGKCIMYKGRDVTFYG